MAEFCASCGTKISSDAAFCSKCGAKVDSVNEELKGKGESLDHTAAAQSPEQGFQPVVRFLKSGVRILWGCIVAIVIFLLFSIWWEGGISPVQVIGSFISPPPVSVTVRQGLLSDAVVRVTNTSDREITVTVKIYREDRYDFATKRIPAQNTKEFGALEFKDGWKPQCGDKGFVVVNYYRRVVVFELGNDSYSSRIQYGVPDDFPGKASSNE